eukprot:UN03697
MTRYCSITCFAQGTNIEPNSFRRLLSCWSAEILTDFLNFPLSSSSNFNARFIFFVRIEIQRLNEGGFGLFGDFCSWFDSNFAFFLLWFKFIGIEIQWRWSKRFQWRGWRWTEMVIITIHSKRMFMFCALDSILTWPKFTGAD